MGLREKKRKKVAPGRRGGRRVEARGFGDLRRGIYDVISSLTVNNFPGGCGRYRGGSRVRFAFFLVRLLSWPISFPTGGRFLVRVSRPPFFSTGANWKASDATPRRPRDTVSRRPKSNIAQIEWDCVGPGRAEYTFLIICSYRFGGGMQIPRRGLNNCGLGN